MRSPSFNKPTVLPKNYKIKKPPRYLDQYLLGRTDKDCKWWMDFIGKTIKKHSKPVKGSVHEETKVELWLYDLTDEVISQVRSKIPKAADGNIAVSFVLGFILVLWNCRIVLAKSSDPRRRIVDRKMMRETANQYFGMLNLCMTDDSMDHKYFPDQKWENPYLPNATNGKYV